MKALFSAILVGILCSGCFWQEPPVAQKTQKPQTYLTKGTISEIRQVKGGYMISALIKNGKSYSTARGFVNSLNGVSSDGAKVMYEVGDLLLMDIKNNVIMYSEVSIKNFTKRDGGVVASKYKRTKNKVVAPLPKESKIKF